MTIVDEIAQHPVVRSALEAAGWTVGYRHDPQPWLDEMRAEGYAITPGAVAVLEELGGLTIDPPLHDGRVFVPDVLVMDPILAAGGESPRIHEWEEDVHRQLTPVAEWGAEYVIVVADDGSVYAEATFEIRLLGATVAEGLRTAIVADRMPPTVHTADGPP